MPGVTQHDRDQQQQGHNHHQQQGLLNSSCSALASEGVTCGVLHCTQPRNPTVAAAGTGSQQSWPVGESDGWSQAAVCILRGAEERAAAREQGQAREMPHIQLQQSLDTARIEMAAQAPVCNDFVVHAGERGSGHGGRAGAGGEASSSRGAGMGFSVEPAALRQQVGLEAAGAGRGGVHGWKRPSSVVEEGEEGLLQGFPMRSSQITGAHRVLSGRWGEQSCYHGAVPVHQPGVRDAELQAAELQAAAVCGQAGMTPFRGSCSGVQLGLPHRTDLHGMAVGNGDGGACVNWQFVSQALGGRVPIRNVWPDWGFGYSGSGHCQDGTAGLAHMLGA